MELLKRYVYETNIIYFWIGLEETQWCRLRE